MFSEVMVAKALSSLKIEIHSHTILENVGKKGTCFHAFA